MRATDVFTPQKLPTATLVTDHLEALRAQFLDAAEEGGKLLRVVGPSKSGKTVFIRNVVDSNLVLVTGAGIDSTDALWIRILDAIGSDVAQTQTQSSGSSGTYSVGGRASGSVFVATAEVDGSMSRGREETATVETTRAVDLLQTVIRETAGSGLWIFIDDFHYIPKAIQASLAEQIKQAVEAGVLLACAAVPYRSEDALRANDDLQGRIADFKFNYWEADKLAIIADLGFKELNIQASGEYVNKLVEEAAGSPQLMQSLCLETCREVGVRETSEQKAVLPEDHVFLIRVCERVANTVDYTTTLDKMKAGPLTRGKQRIPYPLRDGSISDVYPILLEAIRLDPPMLHFRYQDIQARIASLCVDRAPHFSDPCYHIAKIANEGFRTDKIDWDPENGLLSIRDPYLLFAIRWS